MGTSLGGSGLGEEVKRNVAISGEKWEGNLGDKRVGLMKVLLRNYNTNLEIVSEREQDIEI